MRCKKKKMNEEVMLKRGQVYYFKEADVIGSELSGSGRPMLVVSNQACIDKYDHIVVVFMTHSPRGGHGVVKTTIKGKPAYILCTQIRTIDKSRVGNFLCDMDLTTMKRVNNALALTLSFNGVSEFESSDSDEMANVQMELEMYRKLYAKAMAKLTEVRFEYDELNLKKTKPVVAEPEPEMTNEEIAETLEQAGMKVTKAKVSRGEAKTPTRAVLAKVKSTRKANVNTDDWRTIVEITGMNDQTAKEIEKMRDAFGGFEKVEDLTVCKRFGVGCLKKYGPMLEV